MNGPRQRELFSLGGAAEILSPAEARKRLAAALVLSFLLHALLALMPSLGRGWSAAPVASLSGRGALPARALDVRLEAPRAAAPPPAASPSSRAAEKSSLALRLSRGLQLAPLPAQDYFTIEQLTKRPAPASEAFVDVPARAARYVRGNVVLKLWINEFGGVEEAAVEATTLPDYIARNAAEQLRKVPFTPGEINGRPVGVLLRVEVSFGRPGGVRLLD